MKRPRNYADLLKDVLTEEELTLLPRSFDIVGNIAIVELPSQLMGRASLIGQAILNFHKNVRSVYAKIGPVTGIYRTRKLSLIAGEDNPITIHTEYGLRFMIDVSRVYFSPRLSWEHRRVALQVKDGEIVVDMFSGVGPFAIHIASLRKALVYAVDINPYAYECMKESIRLNLKRFKGVVVPIKGASRIVAYAMSGVANRVIMNLPEKALEFIPYALKLLKSSGGTIHFYAFGGSDLNEVIQKLKTAVESSRRRLEEVICVRRVREVAPRKWQIVVDALIR